MLERHPDVAGARHLLRTASRFALTRAARRSARAPSGLYVAAQGRKNVRDGRKQRVRRCIGAWSRVVRALDGCGLRSHCVRQCSRAGQARLRPRLRVRDARHHGQQAIPIVPVLLNAYFPPNQPFPKRCFAFGKALRKAIAEAAPGKRVASSRRAA